MITSLLRVGSSATWLSDKNQSLDCLSLDAYDGFYSVFPEKVQVQEEETFDRDKSISSTVLRNLDVHLLIKNVLTDYQFRIFELRYMHGRTQVDIAKILGISRPVVAIVLKRITRKLRKKLVGIDTLLSMTKDEI